MSQQFRPAILHVCNPQPPAKPQYWFVPDHADEVAVAATVKKRKVGNTYTMANLPADLRDHLQACLALDPKRTAALLEYMHWMGRSVQQASPDHLERHG